MFINTFSNSIISFTECTLYPWSLRYWWGKDRSWCPNYYYSLGSDGLFLCCKTCFSEINLINNHPRRQIDLYVISVTQIDHVKQRAKMSKKNNISGLNNFYLDGSKTGATQVCWAKLEITWVNGKYKVNSCTYWIFPFIYIDTS